MNRSDLALARFVDDYKFNPTCRPVILGVRQLQKNNMERVAWVPGWYELDPPLEVGRDDEFVFWRVVPDYLRGPERLVFYNTLWHPGDGVFGTGKIIAIRHPELGAIRQVDTRGLDYTITLADGTQLLVNAEEVPGKLYEGTPSDWVESKRVISDWRCEVTFESLSELSPQPRRRRTSG